MYITALFLPFLPVIVFSQAYIYIYIYIYIGTQSKCTKRWKQSSAIKQLLEVLFLAIKMCTGFATDGICMNTMCAVSLTNHLRAVADALLVSATE